MKIKLIVLLLTITLLTGLFYGGIKVKAEETTTAPVTTAPTTTEEMPTTTAEPVTTIEVVNEEPKAETKTKAAEWFETNLGWFVGIPVGTLLTLLIDMLVLFKKAKERIAENQSTKDLHKVALDEIAYAKAIMTKSQEIAKAAVETANYVKANIEDIQRRLDVTDNMILENTTMFSNLKNSIADLENKIATLNEVEQLIATHSKELVGNGTAERIVKMLKGEE